MVMPSSSPSPSLALSISSSTSSFTSCSEPLTPGSSFTTHKPVLQCMAAPHSYGNGAPVRGQKGTGLAEFSSPPCELTSFSSVRANFALNAADMGVAVTDPAEGAFAPSDEFRATSLVSSREQVSLIDNVTGGRCEFGLCIGFLKLFLTPPRGWSVFSYRHEGFIDNAKNCVSGLFGYVMSGTRFLNIFSGLLYWARELNSFCSLASWDRKARQDLWLRPWWLTRDFHL